MTDSLKLFFKEIFVNKQLQQDLYNTKEVADVALIAQEMGFNVSAAEVLKAQAGRLIELAASKPEEAKIATAGKKPNIGAQWGREGQGFLEAAGYWLVKINSMGYSLQSFNADLFRLLMQMNEDDSLKDQLVNCKTIDDLEKCAIKNGFEVSAITLLVYQALCILSLSNVDADLVAAGKK